jgi:ParB family transcriptional regulator, chromosome partitioning protein
MEDQGGSRDPAVELIPTERIRVMNPRARDPKKFREIVENISQVGLKKPITVSRRLDTGDGQPPLYDLVCGQGRLEAYVALGEKEIPAIVVTASKEDRLVMSLVENLARRRPASFEHVVQMSRLREQGYSTAEISAKVGLTEKYVAAILKLWEHGEERLLQGLEHGRIPLATAVIIAGGTDGDDQRVLAEAYERGELAGKRLIAAKRLLDQRRAFGKALVRGTSKRTGANTAEALIRSYQKEVERQRVFVKKARLCESRFVFVRSAVQRLLADENFVTLLRAEGLQSLPRLLAAANGGAD